MAVITWLQQALEWPMACHPDLLFIVDLSAQYFDYVHILFRKTITEQH